MKRIGFVLGLVLLTACSSTPEDLEKKPSASRAERAYSQNYQEIYRRVNNAATRCNAGNINAYASFNVNAQLYSELGFGEITLSLMNMGAANFYWKAKISKAGSGSKMSVVSGNTLAQDRMLKAVLRWADGDSKC